MLVSESVNIYPGSDFGAISSGHLWGVWWKNQGVDNSLFVQNEPNRYSDVSQETEVDGGRKFRADQVAAFCREASAAGV